MLPKNQRLKNTRDFKRVYQKGSFFSANIFNLNFLPNHFKNSRVGVVITKKVSSKAVERNLLKRRFREALNEIRDQIPAGFDIIVTIKESSKKAKYEEIKKNLTAAAPRIKKNEKNNHRRY